ncbi:hypothetical protein N9N67_09760 [Bacteriovoracaceae bacterium]|nr:hypothetical protein [Bacteriovoracaceae bacterium]
MIITKNFSCKKWIKLLILFNLILLNDAKSEVFLNGGTFVQYFNEVQISASGGKKTFTLTPYFGIGGNLQFMGGHEFNPEFGFVRYTDTLKGVEKTQLFLHYNFSYQFNQIIKARYGLTTHWYQLKGTGGKQKLNNGAGSTEFDLPDSTVTSYFTTLNLGLEGKVNQTYSIRFDYQMMEFRSSENMSANYLLTLNYIW